MKQFEGKVLFLDRTDVRLDDIPARDVAAAGVIITRDNFGVDFDGAKPAWVGGAAGEAGVGAVVAGSFSRTARQCFLDAGLIAVELPKKDLEDVFKTFLPMETPTCRVTHNDDGTCKVKLISGSLSKSYVFPLEG
jgi:3-isopropylmalate/(R)-2-methylmalate dehydratase small subunit